MDISLLTKEFFGFLKKDDIVAIGTSRYDSEFIDELVKIIVVNKLKVSFVATTAMQAKQLDSLGQEVISLNDREIDVAIEFADQVDQYNNFIKKETKSFIKDKMIAQSALNLIVVCEDINIVDDLNKDIYVELSSFAWERTLLNLQSYGLARVVLDKEGKFIKTEIGHYLARITLDKNITIEDFEYSVRNIPGVLETGVFLGLVDNIFMVSTGKIDELIVKNRTGSGKLES